MPLFPPAPPPIPLTPGCVIRKSVDVVPTLYRLAAPETPGKANDETIPVFPQPAVDIRGSNILVDFHGATLEGTPEDTAPDLRKGLGILVEGVNVTIKNVHVRGYKVGLLARSCPGLRLVDCDFSYNWKQHLGSTLEKEDERDWQFYQRNEKDEWLRYGAGIYLEGCDRFEVRGARVHGGQCGLMLTRCNRGRVWNSDFSFNSGLGIGMYRSSRNAIMHNRMDWDVRGFSYGVYNRGQDSAGILLYEQSNKNTIAYNSVTHGGDGFFLWAGQSTMDTGEGGCDDNLVFANDFSHSPANGIEATFSRNAFVANVILECWHGVWGGYSHDTKIVGNTFGYNGETIAIEHGQDNVISLNRIDSDSAGIDLWQNPITDRNWAYPKHRDTASHSYVIRDNLLFGIPGAGILLKNTTDALIDQNGFQRDGVGISLTNSSHVVASDNRFEGVGTPVRSDSLGLGNIVDVDPGLVSDSDDASQIPAATMTLGGQPILKPPVSLDDYLARFSAATAGAYSKMIQEIRTKGAGAYDGLIVPPLKGGMTPYLPKNALRGQRYILVDEWGPYDFLRPVLWPRGGNGDSRRFEILGPAGKWRVISVSGVSSLSSKTGAVPGELDVRLAPGKPEKFTLTLEYAGGATVDELGRRTPAGTKIRFGYRK